MIQNIVLDLDHTLIVSFTARQLKNKTISPAIKRHVFQPFVIFERPGLKEFLENLSEQYQISVWTAASEAYGQFIVKNIIEPYIGRKVKLFYHYAHCAKSTKQKNLLKHLDILYTLRKKGFTRENTVLIDDNPDILAQNNYIFQINKFTLDPNDNELRRIFKKITTINE